MRAVVLAGGLGMRLRPFTTVLPKPLVPIHGRPILEHILHRLDDCGVTHVDLCVNHLGALIQTYFSQAHAIPPTLNVRWQWENEPLGTAGALRLIPGLDETFIAMNGDVLTTLDYAELVAHHRASGAILTVATTRRTVDIDLGVIELDGERICGYLEKPSMHYDVSMGIYVYEPQALEWIPPAGPLQFPDLVLALLAAGEHVGVYRSDADWYDIGTLVEYERATREFQPMESHALAG